MLKEINIDLLKKMNINELNNLAKEIREKILTTVSNNGGHLASNLGIVELTIALHYVFSSPFDKIIFDVSHQTYAHKIITNRLDQFDTIRLENGISGFAKMNESEHDVFEAGHSSTSISAGLGFLEAKKDHPNEIGEVIAVVGDASIVNGLCFEALNYLGDHQNQKMIIIVNDNNMSVSKNVGALAKRYNKLRTSRSLNWLKKLVPIRIKHAMQYYAYKVDTFTSFGFKYFENIDGHDISQLIKYLSYAKNYSKSIVLHVKTSKGKGYSFAENDKIGFYHGLGPFNLETGKLKKEPTNITYGEAIANRLIALTKEDDSIKVICPAMILGCGLLEYQKQYPNHTIDVGIAEENAVVMAASMAVNKLKPIVFMYSTFIQRSFDEIMHDIARTNQHVVFCIDHAGIVPGDGNTHQGIYDLSMFNIIPGITILEPSSQLDAEEMIEFALNKMTTPVVIRYPKGSSLIGESNFSPDLKWKVLKESEINKYIITYGPDLIKINNRIDEIDNIGLVDAYSINPIDELFLTSHNHSTLYVYEEVIRNGSLASIMNDFIQNLKLNINIISITLPNCYVDEGTVDEIKKRYSITIDDLFKTIKEGDRQC